VVKLERAYIRSWSLLLDAKILARTVTVVVRGNGAY
jgi:lipopolysaccharide/colanic/teichoic acid biosynthesis glycosyltransferase